MNSRKHWAVNWVDGMRVNKTQFREQEAYLNEQDALLAGAALTDHDFGLLPTEDGRASLELVVTSERVELQSCRALTRAGYLLSVGQENNAGLQHRMSTLMYGRDFSEADTWMVVLRVHPDEYLEIGVPDPAESPLRHPFACPRLSLEVVPGTHLQGTEAFHYALPLARILRSYQGIERDRDYIPPVSRTLASERLLQEHQHWKEQLLVLEGDTYEIIRKITDKHRKNEGNQLSADLLHLTRATIQHIGTCFDEYRLRVPQRPPLDLFLWFMGLARTIKNEVRLAGNPENMLAYMAHFIEGVQATDLMTFCNDLCDRDYDHTAIREMVERVHGFMGFVTHLFARLRELDYHQIANPTIIHDQYYGRPATPAPSIVTPPPTRSGGSAIRIVGRGGGTPNTNPSPPPSEPEKRGGKGIWDLE